MKSFDPRINRLDLLQNIPPLKKMEHWPTWEVFHQKKRGAQSVHVGIVHASSPELALVFAKEQYGRRFQCANLWVVKSADVYTFNYEDEDIFDTVLDKKYRDGNFYKVREKIDKYKKGHDVKTIDSGKYFGVE